MGKPEDRAARTASTIADVADSQAQYAAQLREQADRHLRYAAKHQDDARKETERAEELMAEAVAFDTAAAILRTPRATDAPTQ